MEESEKWHLGYCILGEIRVFYRKRNVGAAVCHHFCTSAFNERGGSMVRCYFGTFFMWRIPGMRPMEDRERREKENV